MRYDDAGRWLGAELTQDPSTIQDCRDQRDLAIRLSLPLNIYLAKAKEVRHVP